MVSAYSKCLEIMKMTFTTAQKTITELHKMFAAYGLLTQLVSDNGSLFTAEEFSSFIQANDIKYIRCTPYVPFSFQWCCQTLMQTFKKTMKSYQDASNDTHQSLASFLLTYHSTPHSTTNETPTHVVNCL